MITQKNVEIKEGTWKSAYSAPLSQQKVLLLKRIDDNKLDVALKAIVNLYAALKSTRPLERALNLLEVDKKTVGILTEPIGTIEETWEITSCRWKENYKGKPYFGYYGHTRGREVKLNLDVWKFENTATKKFFLVADKKDIPTDLTRRYINKDLAVIVSGTEALTSAIKIMERYVNV